ncbi:helix-turn-helix domain-containing protein [Chitinophaga sp. RCC_12]|uniref:helix-turn-helix domain-containing protein n=1 Tax=Chitinophaga sp. RCC_12 TaxID=3239226 RepID=UPI003523635F
MATEFGIKVRQLREEGNLLQKQVADQIHVDIPIFRLCKIEKGPRKAQKDQVELFAKALEADSEELLTLCLVDHSFDVVAGERLDFKEIPLVSKHIKNHIDNNLKFANGL